MAEEPQFSVNSVYCQGPGLVIAAGHLNGGPSREGVLLFSEDRGLTWRRAAVEPSSGGRPLMLWSWRISDRENLYASPLRTPQSRISLMTGEDEAGPWWTSRDGGKTWRQAALVLPPALAKGYFLSMPTAVDAQGTLVAIAHRLGKPAVMRSSDGGQHWDARPFEGFDWVQLATDGAGHAAMVGYETPALMRGVARRLFLTSDGAATWNEVTADGLLDNVRLFWSPAGTLVASNGTQRKGGTTVVSHSRDHGRTWRRSAGTGDTGVIAGLAADGTGRLVAVTEYGYVLLSDDDGVSWRTAGQPTTKGTRLPIIPVFFADDGSVTVLLAKGVVLRSKDRGDNWSVIETDLPLYPGSPCADGHGLIVAVSRDGEVNRSIDGGATWQRGRLMN